MSDTLMTIIGIFIGLILMFIFPLVMIAGKNDEIAQTVVEVAVSEFVNTVTTQGKITEYDYSKLIQKLNSTGNSFDIQIEAKILDDNPNRVTTTASYEMIGEYKYYSVYTSTILDKVIGQNSENNEYVLKKDDYVVVTVKNTNITIGTELKNILYKMIGKETFTIGTSSTGLVLNGGTDSKKDITVSGGSVPETYDNKTITMNIKQQITIQEKIGSNLDLIVVLDCEPTTIPWHNDEKHTKDDNSKKSSTFVRNIINAMQGNGSLAFILTCEPRKIYTDLENIDWIYNAREDKEQSAHYVDAFNTAFSYLRNKTRK